MTNAAPITEPAAAQGSYRVLARRYRPQTLADLVGQEAMVRTLRAAFETGRIAQAFILTGIRGTGKTTTARLIAKGLNCIGPDGTGGPTTEPCGVCEPCVAITEGRHVDVLEMDAASRTGVGDVREIIESVAYRAASARHKVYVIDEVHMLSTSAFNALLKTLEEPPPHVVFVFATTEIRKVPVTVLSRCQRFDLRRIEPEAMAGLLSRIATSEGAQVSGDALALIVRAAEGSARDATSLLDQAIATSAGDAVEAPAVRAMLGVADRARTLDLFEMVLRGDAAGAIRELRAAHMGGADPLAVLRDLAEVTHWCSVLKITPEAGDDPTVAPDARERGRALADAAPMRALSRMWQMLLRAIDEVAQAPQAIMAAEMAVIRLTHAADLPTPEELVRRLQDAAPHETAARGPRPGAPAAEGRAPDAREAEPTREGPVAVASGPAADGPEAQHEASYEARHEAGTASNRAAASQGVGQGVGALDDGAMEVGRVDLGRAALGVLGAARAARGAVRGLGAPERRGAHLAAVPASDPVPGPEGAHAPYRSFDDVLALIAERRDVPLMMLVESGVRLVRYAPGLIEYEPAPGAPPDLAQRLAEALRRWTGARWGVSVVSGGGAPTLAEARGTARAAAEAEALRHPLVQAALARFPQARISDIRMHGAEAEAVAPDPEEPEEGWDPFEDG